MNLPVPVGSGAFADLTVYRWSELSLTGGNGVGPVATSLSRADLGKWDERLNPLVWAAQGTSRPGHVYLRFGDQAAVLRKRSVRDPSGRGGSTLTHVLTAPAADLDLDLALALCCSNWRWLPPGGGEGTQERLPPVPLDRLRPHLADATAELDRIAAEVPVELLAPVAAAVLTAPGELVTVVGSPVPGEVVIHALHGALGLLTAGAWSFATVEESDGSPVLPRFVFLDQERHANRTKGTRLRVEADAGTCDGSADADVERAAQLIRFHRRRGAQGLGRLRPSQPLRTAEAVREWQDRHQARSGMVVDMAGMLADAVEGRLDADEAAFLRGRGSVPQVDLHLRRMPPGELESLLRGWAPHRRDLHELQPVRDTLHREAMRRILRSVTDRGALPPGDTAPGLITALRAAAPDSSLVRDCVVEALVSAQGRGLQVDVLGVLMVARGAGLATADLEGLRRRALSQTPVWRLLQQVHRVAMTDPALGRELLQLCVQQRGRRDSRHDIASVLADHRFLSQAVDRMSEGQPGVAVKHYQWLLRCLTGGPTVSRRDVYEVLTIAGSNPPPTLLYALKTAASRAALPVVVEIAADEYFRQAIESRWGDNDLPRRREEPRRGGSHPGTSRTGESHRGAHEQRQD